MEGGTEIGVFFQKSQLEMNKDEECITGSFLLAPFFSLTIGNHKHACSPSLHFASAMPGSE